MEIFNKKLKAILLLISIVALTIPTFATGLTANAGADQTLNVTASNPTVTLNGTASTVDSNGTIVRYEWFYNGESFGTGSTIDVQSVPTGSYIVTLVVTDNLDNTASDTVNIEVIVTPILTANAGPDINVTLTSSNSTLTLDGTASIGTIVKYEWFYNGDSIGTGATLNVGSVPLGYYTVMLIATDDLGNTASDTVNIEIHACDETIPAITRETLMTMIAHGEDVTQVNTCKITDMSHLFDVSNGYSLYPEALRGTVRSFNQDISGWNTSSVTTMRWMFNSATAFNQPLDSWDVSNMTDMYGMFASATAFNQPLDSWDVSSVTNMRWMFNTATAFNQPLDSWDVSSVTDMSVMFARATAFNQPLDNWDVSNVIDIYWMFYDAASFNQPLNSWDVSHMTSLGGMFQRATAFNQPLDNWDVSSAISMSRMFNNAVAFNQNISTWDVLNVLSHSNFADGSALENANNPFYEEVADITKPVIILLGDATVSLTIGDTYTDAGATATDNIDGDITANIQTTSNVDTSVEGNYIVTYAVSDAVGNVADVVTRTVIVQNVNSACNEASAITREALIIMIGNAEDVTQVNTCKITNMSNLFNPFITYPGSQITTVRNFNQDISGWDTSSVTDMNDMFENVVAFNQSLDSWDVSNVTNMRGMFNGTIAFNQPLDSWDTSSVTNMDSMFENTVAFNQPLGNWDVSSVINMSAMFIFAASFNQDISNWDVSTVQSYSDFATGSPLENINNPFNE